jgi:hypothetical protein
MLELGKRPCWVGSGGLMGIHHFRNLMILTVAFALPISNNALANTEGFKPKAVVISVDGKGTAKVRHKSGIESVVGIKAVLLPGDKITTDANSVVQLMLPDGTLVRVGYNTEYKIEDAQVKTGMIAWVFSLTKGTIRALVEKSSQKKESKFRVNTPAGTMGVRGTELILEHNPESEVSTLYTVEGKVAFGAKDCEKKKDCMLVTTGHSASIRRGQRASAIEEFSVGDLAKKTAAAAKEAGTGTSMSASEEANKGSLQARQAAKELEARMSVLQNLGSLGKNVVGMDDTELRKMAEKSSQQLADLQDALLDRTKATRELMEKSAANGTFDDYLALGEKTGGKALEGDENHLSGAANSRKFEAASGAISKSETQSKADSDAAAAAGKTSTSKDASSNKSSTKLGVNMTADQVIGNIKEKETTYNNSLATKALTLGSSTTAAKTMVDTGNKQVETGKVAAKDTSKITDVPDLIKEGAGTVNSAIATATATQTDTAAATQTVTHSAVNVAAVASPGTQIKSEDLEVRKVVNTIATTVSACRTTSGWFGTGDTYCRYSGVDSNGAAYSKDLMVKDRGLLQRSKCYDYKRECTSTFTPCDLSSGKACKGTTKTSCRDVQYQVQCK